MYFFLSNLDAFYFIILPKLPWLEPPVQCQVEVVSADILVLFLILEGKHPVSSSLSMMLAVSFCRCYHVEEIPLFPILLRVFDFVLVWDFFMNRCWILSSAFFASIKMIMWFLLFIYTLH